MPHPCLPRPALLLLTAGTALSLAAQQPTLVKDINPSGSSSINALTCLDGRTYFTATDGVHGIELWATDGTEAGTLQLKDIQEGAGGSYPGPLVVFHGRLYFGANDGIHGEQLWMTDGTEAGTVVVPDIYTGFTQAQGFTPLGDLIYFQGTTDEAGAELWATDGTPAGTYLVSDIRTGPEGSYPGHFAAFGDRLFFSADDGTSGNEVWATDGTDAGTLLIKDILPFGSSNPDDFTVLGDHLVFAAYDEAHGAEPWITDGTTAGTHLLKDINPGGDSSPRDLCTFNGRTFFGAGTSATGGELWVTDGTPGGTELFMDLFPGTTSSQTRHLTTFDGRLYFSAMSNYDDLTQLWRSDGTVAGTAPVFDAAHTPGPLNSNNVILGCGGGIFFDAGYSIAIGEELYTLDVATGMTEDALATDPFLWPNPSSGPTHIKAMPAHTRIGLYAADGRVVLEQAVTGALDLGALPDGLYIARITDTTGAVLGSQRVVKAVGR